MEDDEDMTAINEPQQKPQYMKYRIVSSSVELDLHIRNLLHFHFNGTC